MNPLLLLEGVGLSFIWATALLIPYVLDSTQPVLIAAGRYLVYGSVSLALFLKSRSRMQFSKNQWKTANVYAFTGNIGYYITMALGVHYAGMTVAAMIIGILPLSIMTFGNTRRREIAFSRLAIPGLLILVGIAGINFITATALPNDKTLGEFIVGVVASFASLSFWTWYSVVNSDWLERNSKVSGADWTTAIGVCSLWQAALLIPLMPLMTGESIATSFTKIDPLPVVIIALLYIGIINTWFSTMWWNRLSRKLPLSLAGQLLVFATVASIIYGHLVDRTLPTGLELLFVALQISGVGFGVHQFSKHGKTT